MTFAQSARIGLVTILLGLCAATPVLSAGDQMTLADCIAVTLRENRDIKNAYLDRVAQKYDLRVAEDKFTPKLMLTPSLQSSGGRGAATSGTGDLSGTVSELLPTGASINLSGRYDFITSSAATPSRSSGWDINLIQPLLKGGGLEYNLASVRTARLAEKGNILSLKDTLMNTIVSVVNAYRTYAQSIKTLDIQRQSLERSRATVETTREMIAAGRVAAVDIVQSEADMARQELSLLTAENDVNDKRLALLKAIDIDKNTAITPVLEVSVPPIPYTLEQAKKLAFENKPDYLKLLLSYETSKISLMQAKNNTLWDLSLTGSYGETYLTTLAAAQGSSTSTTGSWTTMLKLSIPIGDLSIQQGYITQSIGLKKMENDLAKQREAIEIEVQNKLRNAEMSLRQIKLAKKTRELSERTVEIEMEKFKIGKSTNFNLVIQQNNLVSAQNSELSEIINYLNALTELDKYLGLTLDKLGVSLVER